MKDLTKELKEDKTKQCDMHSVSKSFSISDMEDMFFAGYFHHPTGDLDDGKQDHTNDSFMKVMRRGGYI